MVARMRAMSLDLLMPAWCFASACLLASDAAPPSGKRTNTCLHLLALACVGSNACRPPLIIHACILRLQAGAHCLDFTHRQSFPFGGVCVCVCACVRARTRVRLHAFVCCLFALLSCRPCCDLFSLPPPLNSLTRSHERSHTHTNTHTQEKHAELEQQISGLEFMRWICAPCLQALRI